MAECVNPKYEDKASRGPVGSVPEGDPYAQFGAHRGPEVAADAHASVERLRAILKEAQDNIVSMTADGSLSGTIKLNNEMLAGLSKIASSEARRQELIRIDSLMQAIERNERDLTRIGQSVQSNESLWKRFTTDMDYKLVDDSARLKAYFLSIIGETGRGADNNLGVSVLQSTINMMRGRTSYYERQMGSLMGRVAQWIGRGSKASPQDAMHWIGDVAAANQVKQRNDNLLAVWGEKAAFHDAEAAKFEARARRALDERGEPTDESKKLVDKAIVQREAADEYREWIADLRARRNEDSIEWTDEKGEIRKTRCCGYLDGEAAVLREESLRKLGEIGIGEDQVGEIIAGMRKIYLDAEDSLTRNHQVSHTQLERWREVRDFLPFVHDSDNANELGTSVSVYTPGYLHLAEGMTEHPVNVWDSLHHFARRSAYRVGMSDVAQLLYNVHRAKGAASGLRVTKWGSVSHLSKEDYAKYLQTIASGGLVSDVIDAKGNVQRVYIRFDNGFKSLNRKGDPSGKLFDGAMLNEALTGLARRSDKLGFVGKVTGGYGMMFTRFNPGFPLVNSVRDFGERMYNMLNRDYRDAAGNIVPGTAVAGSMVANTSRAFRVATDAAWGRMDMNANTPEARYLREFIKQGLDSVWLKDLGTDVRGIGDALSPASSVPYLRDAAKTMPGRAAQGLMKAFDGWNSMMNNIAPLAQYMALREHGVSAKEAGVAVGEMLNNNLTGKWTNFLRSFFPFVRPTLQGARALLRSFGLAADARGGFSFRPRNAATMLAFGAGAGALYSFFRDGLGESEGGAYNMDAIGVSQIASALPFMPDGEGGYLKLPVPFGVQRVLLGMAAATDRVNRGVISPEEGMFQTIATLAKQVSPADFPEWAMRSDPIAWLGQAFAPSLLRPMVDVMANKNFAGRPVVWGGQGGDEGVEPKAYKGYAATAPMYKSMAREIFEDTGMDFAPEQLRALARGYSGGILRGLLALKESDNPGIDEMRKTSVQELGPLLTALGGTMYYGKLRDADMQMFFDAKSRLLQDVKYAGVEWKNEKLAKARNPEAYRAWRVQQLRDRGWSEEKLADLDTVLRLDAEIRKSHQDWRKPLLEAVRMEDDGDELKSRFRQKFDAEHSIYAEAVETLNLFHGGW